MSKTNTIHPGKPQFDQRISAWFLHNLQALIFSLGQLWRKPFSSLLTAAVIGIALTLPTGFYVLLTNAERLTQDWGGSIEITAFLQHSTSQGTVQSLMNELRSEAEIEAVKFVSSEQALEEYKALSGFSEALDMLSENPLPSLLLIDITRNDLDQNQINTLLQRLKSQPEIELVIMDRQWLQRLQLIIETIRRSVYIISCILALGVLLIVGNTIRLNINTNRQEIEITKLFGGTNAFIQRPFLYSGFWYGLFGGLIAWLLVTVSLMLLIDPINQLTALYTNKIQITNLTLIEVLILIVVGSSLGLAGSWLSVEQHIRHIEPQ